VACERWRLAGVFHGNSLAAGAAASQESNFTKTRNRHKKHFFFAPFVAFCGLNL